MLRRLQFSVMLTPIQCTHKWLMRPTVLGLHPLLKAIYEQIKFWKSAIEVERRQCTLATDFFRKMQPSLMHAKMQGSF